MKKALVVGATGLVGNQLVLQLLEDARYSQVTVLVRRPIDLQHAKLRQEVFDFDHSDPDKVKGDDLFCALGTTLKKAGSKEAQYRIDCTYPVEIGRIARQNDVKQYLLVSALGAKAGSANFYLRTKGELEQQLEALHFDCFVAARPSILLGDRTEFRLGEKIGTALNNLLSPIIPRHYRGVQASQVAHSLIEAANKGLTGVHYLENESLLKSPLI